MTGNNMLSITDGHLEIRGIQKKYNKRIDQAPKKSGWNKFAGCATPSKYDLETAKFNAIRAVVQDYAVFGIELLSDENLAKLKPKQESLIEQTRRELG